MDPQQCFFLILLVSLPVQRNQRKVKYCNVSLFLDTRIVRESEVLSLDGTGRYGACSVAMLYGGSSRSDAASDMLCSNTRQSFGSSCSWRARRQAAMLCSNCRVGDNACSVAVRKSPEPQPALHGPKRQPCIAI